MSDISNDREVHEVILSKHRDVVKLPPNFSKEPVRLSLKQQITRVSGSARIDGKDVLLEDAKLKGERLSFKLALGGRSYDFTGTVRGQSIAGSVDVGGGKAAWSAAQAK